MIHKTIKIGKEKLSISIPENWREVTFKQFLECNKENDSLKRVSILTGIPLEFFQYQELVDVYVWIEGVLSWSNEFIEKDSKVEVFKTPTGLFYFPKDIELKSIGAYKDIQSEAQDHEENILEIFPFICSAYYVLDRDGEYDYAKAKSMIGYFESESCMSVLNSGNFFLNKLKNLRSGTERIQRSPTIRVTKFLQAMIEYLKSLVLKLF